MSPIFLTLGILIITLNTAFSMHFSTETVTACQAESGFAGNIRDFPVETDPPKEGKCFVACLLEKEGMMVNGVVDKATATESINRITNGNQERAQRYLRILNECLAEVTTTSDKCENAFQYMKCKRSKSMGK